MGNLFGKKKASRVTEHDKAVLQVKQQRDNLKQYQKRIETKLESDRHLAKRLLLSGQKERAKLILKKKRYQESLLQKTDTQLENLEKLVQELEYAQVEVQVVEGLKTGSEALKSINQLLDIDEIERIMDETREGIEKQEEINTLISGKLSVEDLEDVEKEYEELMRLEQEAEDKAIILPDVPSDEPVIEKEKGAEKPKEKREKIAVAE